MLLILFASSLAVCGQLFPRIKVAAGGEGETPVAALTVNYCHHLACGHWNGLLQTLGGGRKKEIRKNKKDNLSVRESRPA